MLSYKQCFNLLLQRRAVLAVIQKPRCKNLCEFDFGLARCATISRPVQCIVSFNQKLYFQWCRKALSVMEKANYLYFVKSKPKKVKLKLCGLENCWYGVETKVKNYQLLCQYSILYVFLHNLVISLYFLQNKPISKYVASFLLEKFRYSHPSSEVTPGCDELIAR